MTQPVPHGYPDYGLFAARVDKLYANIHRVGGGLTETLGPYFVGDIPALSVKFSSSLAAAQVFMRFWVDAALTTELQSHLFGCSVPQITNLVVPVMGPYLTIDMFTSVGPVDWNLQLASCVNGQGALTSNDRHNVLISAITAPVAAAATSTFTAARVVPGPGIWAVETALATYDATLQQVMYTGAATRLDTINQTHPKGPRPFFAGNSGLQASFTNTTGAAGNWTVCVSVESLLTSV